MVGFVVHGSSNGLGMSKKISTEEWTLGHKGQTVVIWQQRSSLE